MCSEASLFADANFDFRGLAVQEMRKYSKNFMAEGAAALAEGVTLDSFTHYGKVRWLGLLMWLWRFFRWLLR